MFQNLHFTVPKKFIVCLIPFNRRWFELRKTPHRMPVCLIPFNRGWFELRKTPHRVLVSLVPFNLIFLENNGFRTKMCGILKIDLFIRYNFCRKCFFSRSIFIDIKWKNLLKTFFFSFELENQICGYFHHHIRNSRLEKRVYSDF